MTIEQLRHKAERV